MLNDFYCVAVSSSEKRSIFSCIHHIDDLFTAYFNFLQGESFMFLTVYINCYLYLMTLVAYLKKSSFS